MANKRVKFYNQSDKVIVDCVITEEKLEKLGDKIADYVYPNAFVGDFSLPYETEIITDIHGDTHTLNYNPLTRWEAVDA